jgi:hypothetical protein
MTGESMAHQLKKARRDQEFPRQLEGLREPTIGTGMTAEAGHKIEAEKVQLAAIKVNAQKKQAEARAVKLARADIT